ncbi:MAG TPA: TolC family outer membrane protein [Steroidobacteraceae bacterium]|nr:TolC family outer membrane protein [Steroidobacteraceae bacterium]
MHPVRSGSTAAILAGLMLTCGSASAAGLGLADAWQAAMRHDPQFESARAQWEAGRTHAAQGRALWMPTLAAQGSAGRTDQQSRTSGAAFSAPGFGSTDGVDFQTSINNGTSTQWAIVAEQPLYDAGRMADFTAQKNTAAIADAQYQQARQDLLLRTARAYFAVINARAQLVALRRLRAAAEQARAAAQGRYELGDIAVTDMREAQARADAIGVQDLDAQTAVSLSEAAFTDLTGLEPVALRGLSESEPAQLPAPESLEAWTQRALAGNPQLAVQRLAVATASAQVDRFGILASPKLSIVARVGRDSVLGGGDFGASDITARDASIALQASIPLFTGGLRSAQRHEAKALEQKAGADLDAADQQVRQEARTAWFGLTNAAARVRALQRLRGSTQDRLGATQLGVQIGERTALDLLNAQADFLLAGTDMQKAQSQWLLADLQLAAVAGGLSEADLERIDHYLVDPVAESK